MGRTGYQPVPWSLNIYEPQRGSVPKPNVVPRLRDYVGLACQHGGNPNGRDFHGQDNLTILGVGPSGRSFKAEVDFEIVEPGNFGTDTLARQFLGQMLIMVLQQRGVGRVVKGNYNRFLLDPNVSFQTLKEIARQVSGIPLHEGRSQSLSQLMKGRLGYEHHA